MYPKVLTQVLLISSKVTPEVANALNPTVEHCTALTVVQCLSMGHLVARKADQVVHRLAGLKARAVNLENLI